MIERVTKSWMIVLGNIRNDSSRVIHTAITIICLMVLVAYFTILNF